jgi:hypothetical protein
MRALISRRFDGWVSAKCCVVAVAGPLDRWRPHPSNPLKRRRVPLALDEREYKADRTTRDRPHSHQPAVNGTDLTSRGGIAWRLDTASRLHTSQHYHPPAARAPRPWAPSPRHDLSYSDTGRPGADATVCSWSERERASRCPPSREGVLVGVLARQLARTESVEKATGRIIPWLFKGRPSSRSAARGSPRARTPRFPVASLTISGGRPSATSSGPGSLVPRRWRWSDTRPRACTVATPSSRKGC